MLTNLEYLDVSGNTLTGSIPSDLWAMPALNTLLVKDNKLSFELPSPFPESSKLGKSFGEVLNPVNLKTQPTH